MERYRSRNIVVIDPVNLNNYLKIDSNGNIGQVIKDVNNNALVIDTDIGGARTIEAEHSKIHAGLHYFANDYNADIDADGVYIWTIENGSKMAHMTFNIVSSLNGTWQLLEGVTVSNTPTAVNSFNSKRNQSNTTDTVIKKGATLSDEGTSLIQMPIGTDGANPVGANGGNFDRKNEKELKTNTKYALKYTSLTDNNRVGVLFEWYYED